MPTSVGTPYNKAITQRFLSPCSERGDQAVRSPLTRCREHLCVWLPGPFRNECHRSPPAWGKQAQKGLPSCREARRRSDPHRQKVFLTHPFRELQIFPGWRQWLICPDVSPAVVSGIPLALPSSLNPLVPFVSPRWDSLFVVAEMGFPR